MQRRRFLAGAVGGGLATLLSGCGEGIDARRVAVNGSVGSGNGNTSNDTRTKTGQGLVLRSHRFYRQGTNQGVRGVVENRAEVDLDFITAYARFFNESGTQIGRASDTEGNGLEVGETWQFIAEVTETNPANVARYQLVVIDQRSSEVSEPFANANFSS